MLRQPLLFFPGISRMASLKAILPIRKRSHQICSRCALSLIPILILMQIERQFQKDH